MDWQGKHRTIKNPAVFVAEKDFFFGGKLIKAGSLCKQFETTNFGWTVWTDPDGNKHTAQE